LTERLAGKRPITARPAAPEARSQVGHWEADTMLGAGQAGPCVLTLVERTTGYLLIGKRLYLYGYVHRIRSSRRLEQETHRNVELMWLLRRLTPDHKTIAGFRRDHPQAVKGVCREFTLLCRRLDLFGGELLAIDGSTFRAVNAREAGASSRPRCVNLGVHRCLNSGVLLHFRSTAVCTNRS
jgi:hypothetical protein